MIRATYTDTDSGLPVTLYCGCGINQSGRVMDVEVEPGAPSFSILRRLLNDVARLVSMQLRLGVSPQRLFRELNHDAPGLATVRCDASNGGADVATVASMVGAVAFACTVAEAQWRLETRQLAAEGVVSHG